MSNIFSRLLKVVERERKLAKRECPPKNRPLVRAPWLSPLLAATTHAYLHGRPDALLVSKDRERLLARGLLLSFVAVETFTSR